MNGWALFASITGGVASLLVIMGLLWNIASTTTLLASDVASNKKTLEVNTKVTKEMQTNLSYLVDQSENLLEVEFVNRDNMILKVPEGYERTYIKVKFETLDEG